MRGWEKSREVAKFRMSKEIPSLKILSRKVGVLVFGRQKGGGAFDIHVNCVVSFSNSYSILGFK